MPDKLIPRAYQEEIFNRAKEQNIIAALETGSGKTFIAVLLIRWLASRHTGDRKIFVFIVPRVPLVVQQQDFLREHLPLTVRGYYGAVVDLHDPVRWSKEFKECDVMVMTAQVFLDAMSHAHWSMSQVALLVFDEAHHAQKNNPYNQILQDFYLTCDPRLRPKVFGMTASPVWNHKNPYESLRVLERNMQAKIIGVQVNNEELAEHSPRPTEIVLEYPISDVYSHYPRSLWDRFEGFKFQGYQASAHENMALRYQVTRQELGPYSADFYLCSYVKTLVSDQARKAHYGSLMAQTNVEEDSMPDILTASEADVPSSPDSSSADIQTRLSQMEWILREFHDEVSFDHTAPIPNEWLSPKLRILVSTLLERRSSSFQGIIFVEQRQVAATLAWILPRIPELKGWITSGALVGHGTGRHLNAQGLAEKKQKEILKSFRSRACNLLVSTSVGEEGFDFQACDLIIRFNQLQNMVGYLQSRGRARRFDSTYIVMVAEGSSEGQRYERMRLDEPLIKQLYQQRHLCHAGAADDQNEIEDPRDIAARLRYAIHSTGAVLTFGSAISLLNNLCALIPRDKYTKVSALQPVYSGDFQSTVKLPSALPIPRDMLTYSGAYRSTKREAKAAAAFIACKSLHELGVFDDYLLPARKTSGDIVEDADGRLIPEVNSVPSMMDVLVHDPWSVWDDGRAVISEAISVFVYPMSFPFSTFAIVVGTFLGTLPLVPTGNGNILFAAPRAVSLPKANLRLLIEYTAFGIRWCNTSKTIKSLPTCLMAIIDSTGQLDIESMRSIVENPSSLDPANITQEDEGQLLLQSTLEPGRPLLLRCLRNDLNPLSRPPIGEQFDTFIQHWEHVYKRRNYPVHIPTEGALVMVETFARNFSSVYPLPSRPQADISMENPHRKSRFVPAGTCEICVLSQDTIQSFRTLPQVIRRITDVYRARKIIEELGLPALQEDLVVEALTLPCATAGFSNQRLETLGDSVLKLCVVVHLFNKYPFRHEGQLDGMRRNSVSNRGLLARAKDIGLERFLTSEPSSTRAWRPTAAEGKFVDGVWFVQRKFARRSLQDCMEALLGVSFLTGRIEMALQTGTALKLCFGGPEHWSTRYIPRDPSNVPSFFSPLENKLGYRFKTCTLLMEAFTHPSFTSDNACYQRLEFLGDALIDLVVLEYLYKKFPHATSGQLTWAKSRAVWAPALTIIAIKQLELHKYLLSSNVELEMAIKKTALQHIGFGYEHIVLEGWRYELPKAISDIMESLCGAMLIDSGYDYEGVRAIIERLMMPILEVLRPNLPRDPTSELLLALAQQGCQRAKFQRFASEDAKNNANDSIRFIIHDVEIGAICRPSVSLSRAKPLLAVQVKRELEDVNSKYCLRELCDCRETVSKDIPDEIAPETLDDEKEEDFAVLGLLELREVEGGPLKNADSGENKDWMGDEEEGDCGFESDSMY
ncbi:hypothetical protein BU17DRAFT_46941 [Hysterangium stoloniferum]|nr:hypothetical protein BU17DRAFT_46941 [Hysterangium stoloniferum]